MQSTTQRHQYELSHLALTSQAEHVVRDRLAWALSKHRFPVARDWRDRGDLAVLDDDRGAYSALELKATCTHDTTWSMTRTELIE